MEEESKERLLEVNNQKFTIEHKNPYGFWWFRNASKTPLPEPLRGAFTSPDEAEKAAKRYVFNTK